jgi:hypothetical protein
MNCPHCQKELPENYLAMWCPFCGKNLLPEVEPSRELPPIKFNWRLFSVALLSPALLTLVSAAAARFLILSQPRNESVSPWVGLIGGAIGGVMCGVMLGFQASRNLSIRIMLSILMSVIMMAVCILLCFFGCSVGGYQMRLN